MALGGEVREGEGEFITLVQERKRVKEEEQRLEQQKEKMRVSRER